MSNKGFSIIELAMVTVVVTILASLAVTLYKSHRDSAKYAAMRPIVQGYIQQAILYYNDNGLWPSASDLGISASSVGQFDTSEMNAVNPELLELFIRGSNSGIFNCSNYGSVEFTFQDGATTDGSNIAAFWDYAYINGKLEITCWDESGNSRTIVGNECKNSKYPGRLGLQSAACN